MIHKTNSKINRLFLSENQKGFTLIEVMVALGLMGISIMFFTEFMQNQYRAQKSMNVDNEIASVHRQLSSVLSNNDICIQNFRGTPLASWSDTYLLLDVNGDKTLEPEVGLSMGLRLSKVDFLEDDEVTSSVTAPDATGIVSGSLRLVFDRDYNSSSTSTRSNIGLKFITRRVPIRVQQCQTLVAQAPDCSAPGADPGYCGTSISTVSTLCNNDCTTLVSIAEGIPSGNVNNCQCIEDELWQPASGEPWMLTLFYNCDASAPVARCVN